MVSRVVYVAALVVIAHGILGEDHSLRVQGEESDKMISYGKGSRSNRCLCDKLENCETIKGSGQPDDLGNNGYDRCASDTCGGSGYCPESKELAKTNSPGECVALAKADPECKKTPPKGTAIVSDERTYCVGKICYRALDPKWKKASTERRCQDYYLTVPAGWRVADFNCDILKKFGWNTLAMCFSDGKCRLTKNFSPVCKIYRKGWTLERDGTSNRYKSNDCYGGVMISNAPPADAAKKAAGAVSVSSSKSTTFATSTANRNGKIWNDRDYTFTQLPAVLDGAAVFQGPTRIPDGDVLTFSGGKGTFYALLTLNRDGGYLSSLTSAGWIKEGEMAASWKYKQQDNPMTVLSKSVTAGTLKLPAASGSDTVVAFLFKSDVCGDRVMASSCKGKAFIEGSFGNTNTLGKGNSCASRCIEYHAKYGNGCCLEYLHGDGASGAMCGFYHPAAKDGVENSQSNKDAKGAYQYRTYQCRPKKKAAKKGPQKCKLWNEETKQVKTSCKIRTWWNAPSSNGQGCGALDTTEGVLFTDLTSSNLVDKWYQMDLGTIQWIGGVVTQSSSLEPGKIISKFEVSVSPNSASGTWSKVKGADGNAEMAGNTPKPKNNKVVNMFDKAYKGRYVRIYITGFTAQASLRAGVYGKCAPAAGGSETLLVLKDQPTKGNSGSYGNSKPVDGISSSSNLDWGQCGHYTGDTTAPAFWAVDLGAQKTVTKVKLYNRNDCCPERLTGIKLYLGDSWSSYSANTLVRNNINVPRSSPLEISIGGAQGRYLWVEKDSARMTLCEIQVWAQVSAAGSAYRTVNSGTCCGSSRYKWDHPPRRSECGLEPTKTQCDKFAADVDGASVSVINGDHVTGTCFKNSDGSWKYNTANTPRPCTTAQVCYCLPEGDHTDWQDAEVAAKKASVARANAQKKQEMGQKAVIRWKKMHREATKKTENCSRTECQGRCSPT